MLGHAWPHSLRFRYVPFIQECLQVAPKGALDSPQAKSALHIVVLSLGLRFTKGALGLGRH